MANNVPSNQNLPGGHEKIDDNFDVAGLFLDFLSHWKFFVISLVVCLGIAFLYIHTVIPTFKVGASVYLNDDNATKTSAVSMSADNPLVDTKSMIDETEIEIMKSRNSLLKVVDTLQLAYSYYQIGRWRDVPVYKSNPVCAYMDSLSLANLKQPLSIDFTEEDGVLDVTVTDNDDYEVSAQLDSLPGIIETQYGNIRLEKNGDKYNGIYGTNRVVIKHPNTVAATMASNLTVQYAEKSTTILNFTYVNELPELGNDILKMMIYFYNKQIIEDKNRAAIQTEAFILDRLGMISNELKDVESRLRDYRQTHNIANVEAQVSMNLSQKSSTEAEASELASQEVLLRDLLSQARNLDIAAERSELMTLPAISPNASLNASIDQFNNDIRRYNRQRRDMTAEQPLIQNGISSLLEQREQIVQNIQSAQRQVSEQRRNISRIENRSSSQLAAQPSIDKGLQEIFREQSVKVNIYTFLLQKREEIALQKTLATPTAQFIDDPSVLQQVAPNILMIYLVGFVIGLLIPGLWILIKRLLFPKFKEKEDIQRVTSVPVIAEICQTTENESTDIVVGENVSTSVAELFRLMRNNITFARTGGDKKVVLLTSSVSGEGKTFIALNLAVTYALTKKRVVVVGLDIRRPVLAHKFGLSNRVGVTSYLSDQINDINDILFPIEGYENLYVIPAGPVPPNPNELLMSERMEEFFTQLRQNFDYIIVDSAPIGLVSDSFLIVPHTDMQLFVTRASYTTRKGLRVLHEAINTGQLPKAYIVLNGVNTGTRTYNYRRYGSYHSSKKGYGYGYGYGYGNRPTKRTPWYKRIFKRL